MCGHMFMMLHRYVMKKICINCRYKLTAGPHSFISLVSLEFINYKYNTLSNFRAKLEPKVSQGKDGL